MAEDWTKHTDRFVEYIEIDKPNPSLGSVNALKEVLTTAKICYYNIWSRPFV